MIALISFALVVLALAGVPLFAIIALATLTGYYFSDIDLSIIGIELYRIADTPLLVALPLFIIAGYVLAESKASQRLVNLSQALLGGLPHGLAIIALVSCAFFTAFTGASGATIVALGALLYPALQSVGYSQRSSLGLVTSGGSLGLLLVPSLPLIIYGVLAQQMDMGPSFTLKQLFLAGLLPTLIMVVLLCAWVVWSNRHIKLKTQDFNWSNIWQAIWAARWEIPLPFVVLGGIYGGWFAISDMAAVTALYVLIVEVVLYREVSLRQLPGILQQAATMIGSIILILGVSLAFSNLIIDNEIPDRLLLWIQQYVDSALGFLLLLNIALLVLGAILDIFSALVIMVPLILPVALSFNIHPVHLGIIFLANLQIGYLTPPVGMNLFISSYRFKQPITTVVRSVIPYALVLLVGLALITYIPWLSMAFID
ncbi:trap dicarboxylate transporter, dctm subunit [gamma proteobacterium NOR5-3]|nr:trap dicarboxylate transporter, dctm subunit [gamma proteobacterium NOR5-3]